MVENLKRDWLNNSFFDSYAMDGIFWRSITLVLKLDLYWLIVKDHPAELALDKIVISTFFVFILFLLLCYLN